MAMTGNLSVAGDGQGGYCVPGCHDNALVVWEGLEPVWDFGCEFAHFDCVGVMCVGEG